MCRRCHIARVKSTSPRRIVDCYASNCYASVLREAGASGLIRDLAESLIAYPYVDVSRTAARLDSTFPTVNEAVARLVSLGILRERTGRSHGRLFEAPAVVGVLTARTVTEGRAEDLG